MLLEHLSGDAAGIHCGRPAGVKRHVGDQLRELILGYAVIQRTPKMAAKLVRAARCHEDGDRDQAAVSLRKLRPLPDIAVENIIAKLPKLR